MRLSDEKLASTFQSVSVLYRERARRCSCGTCHVSYHAVCETIVDLTGLPHKEVWERCLDMEDDGLVIERQFAWRN